MAEAVKDILFDDTGDLAWVDGDLVWDHSDDQHIQDILTAVPSYYTLYPLVGANIRTMINGSAPGDLFGEIRSQLIADGYEVNKVDYIDGALNIDCVRKSVLEPINGEGNFDVHINITVQDSNIMATVTNSNGSFTVTFPVGVPYELHDITYTDIYGVATQVPACINIAAVVPTFFYANSQPIIN